MYLLRDDCRLADPLLPTWIGTDVPHDVKPDSIVYDWVLGVGAEEVYTFFMLAHDAHPVTLVILVLERPSW